MKFSAPTLLSLAIAAQSSVALDARNYSLRSALSNKRHKKHLRSVLRANMKHVYSERKLENGEDLEPCQCFANPGDSKEITGQREQTCEGVGESPGLTIQACIANSICHWGPDEQKQCIEEAEASATSATPGPDDMSNSSPKSDEAESSATSSSPSPDNMSNSSPESGKAESVATSASPGPGDMSNESPKSDNAESSVTSASPGPDNMSNV